MTKASQLPPGKSRATQPHELASPTRPCCPTPFAHCCSAPCRWPPAPCTAAHVEAGHARSDAYAVEQGLRRGAENLGDAVESPPVRGPVPYRVDVGSRHFGPSPGSGLHGFLRKWNKCSAADRQEPVRSAPLNRPRFGRGAECGLSFLAQTVDP